MAAILFAYGYALFLERPYAGFQWDAYGRVAHVSVIGAPQNQILVGDRLVRVGSLSWVQYHENLAEQFFLGARPGQAVPIVVERAGRLLTVNWIFPGWNTAEFLEQLLSVVWFSGFFWLLGTDCLLHMRPRGLIRALGVACNYLTALWLMMLTNISTLHLWYGPLVLRLAVWLAVPTYLLFHVHLDRPVNRISPPLLWLIYPVAAAIAVAEYHRLLPDGSYHWGLGIALCGILTLLGVRARRDPADRMALQRLIVLAVISVIPIGTVPLLSISLPPDEAVFLGLLGVPCLALGYFTIISRGALGNTYWRASRAFALYAYMFLVLVILVPVTAFAVHGLSRPGLTLLIAALAGLAGALTTVFAYAPFQAFVELRLLRAPIASGKIVSTFAARIASTTAESALSASLRDEIFPSLLIEDFVFIRFDSGGSRTILAGGSADKQDLEGWVVRRWLSGCGRYAFATPTPEFRTPAWVQLVVPLWHESTLLGAWFVGLGEPQVSFSRAEMVVIQSVADETALALSNITQTERLRSLYQADIARHEEERLRLALRLHDSVLSEMAAVFLQVDESSVSPGFQGAFEAVVDRVRDLVSDLRPPLLEYGLGPGLEGLCDRLGERARPATEVRLNLQGREIRYPGDVELQIFRAVQESLENALRHAHASTVVIDGSLEPESIQIVIQDDGKGLELPDGAPLDTLIARKHFGMAGMMERASLIGASVQISSVLGSGTRVAISWSSKSTHDLQDHLRT